MAGLMMRGTDETSGSLFSYADLGERIPVRHPLRKIRHVVNDALAIRDTVILNGLMLVFVGLGIALWPWWWSAPFWLAYGVL